MSAAVDALEKRLRALAGDRPRDVAMRAIDSPVGPLVAGATDAGLVLLEFGRPERLEPQLEVMGRLFGGGGPAPHPRLDQTEAELAEYFAGTRRDFDVPLVIRGTEFQERVWHELLRIPYGETTSYAALADTLGVRNGQRAVGLANGRNRLAIIVPCHRVIEKGGGLRGYGGGLDRKRFLLDLERRHTDPLAGTPLGRLAAG
ncbi:MAG: methylated-DNA--[protein]-cysteine S-methyltransferase [Gemmatimonadales bacterium]